MVRQLLPLVDAPDSTHGKSRSKIISRLFQNTPPNTLVVSLDEPNTNEPLSRSPPLLGTLTCALPMLNSTPLKSRRVITLITPPIASEPYTAEAPSERISIRSIAPIGIEFKSCEEPVEGDMVKRRPSTNTKVRPAPKPRISTLLTPCAVEPDVGRPEPAELNVVLRISSAADISPESSIASRSITVTGKAPSISVR